MSNRRERARLLQVDMSPEGIDRRMRELGQLYRLGLKIAKARPLGKLRHSRQRSQRRTDEA